MGDRVEVLKSTLIAIAVLTVFDAAVWQGRYRAQTVQTVQGVIGYVTGQDWTSGPLV